ncbi:hypothetical protein SASPL_157542 [Salvia splendens]|uniref:Uncharacterized protein n=1 Tax=Salvia splendens TaxID=180675 RepID=A0A8X8YVA6_SALSN|nr:hypothetical protein SASPL_157542 [Salvia splendens]
MTFKSPLKIPEGSYKSNHYEGVLHCINAKGKHVGDSNAQRVIEAEKLKAYMKKKVHKYAEIVQEKKKEGEKKEKVVKVVEEKTTVIKEFKEVEKVEVKAKDGGAPYFIHYVHAPQLFSDENPNACAIM